VDIAMEVPSTEAMRVWLQVVPRATHQAAMRCSYCLCSNMKQFSLLSVQTNIGKIDRRRAVRTAYICNLNRLWFLVAGSSDAQVL
jgi:hypothetical protein